MFKECILLDTNMFAKEDKTYYMVLCYFPEYKASMQVFVDKYTYEYCDELPSYEDITNIVHLSYDRKINAFKISINIDKI